jgi:hypothetical protein
MNCYVSKFCKRLSGKLLRDPLAIQFTNAFLQTYEKVVQVHNEAVVVIYTSELKNYNG